MPARKPVIRTPQDLQELDTAIEKAAAVADELSARINDARASSKPVGETDWIRLTTDFRTAEGQLAILREKRKETIEFQPNATIERKRVIEQDPIARYVSASARTKDGFNGLESWEISEQQQHRDRYGSFDGQFRPGDMIVPIRHNAAVTTTTTAGAIPITTESMIVDALADFGAARKMCKTYRTTGGGPLHIPTRDETATVGHQITTEGSAAAEATPATIGQKTLNAFTYTSDLWPVSRESVSDVEGVGLNLIQDTLMQCARSIGRATETAFCSGTGSGQPEGFLTNAPVGRTSAKGGGAAFIEYDDLIELEFSIDRAYRMAGGEAGFGGRMPIGGGTTGFMIPDGLEKHVMLWKDSDGRPLWAPGLSSIAGSPRMNTIIGYPYVVNQSMPQNMAKNQVVGAFGAWSYFAIREVDAILIRSYDDSYGARANLYHCIAWARFDSGYIGPGSSSVAYKTLKTKNADEGG